MTKQLDPKDNFDNEKLTKIWGRLGTSMRQYLILKDHFERATEKCCKLLSVNRQGFGCPKDGLTVCYPTLNGYLQGI